MWRNVFLKFYCIFQVFMLAHSMGTYTIVAPGTIRSNFKYNVAVSLHKADGPSQIKVGITGPSYNESKTVEVQPMSTENIEFDVPKLQSGDYNITAEGVSGVVFKNSTKLNHADYKPSTFIQTDKATYKPGDLVQFRVLFLDENTRPANIEKPVSIVITDGAQNRLKQLKDVQLTSGVYTGEYQLSEQPVLGNWNIEVLVDGDSVETKSFEVDKYVLPKFEVTIDTAKDVAIADGVIKATVRAKYTYGKPVKGKATISIKPAYHQYYSSNEPTLEAEKTIDVDGKGHVEFDLTKDLRISSDRNYLPPLKLVAVMEEALTANKQNTTATVNLHADRYRIESIEAPYNYHPGKPVIFKIVVKNLDNSPVQDTKNPVKLELEPPRGYFRHGIRPVTAVPFQSDIRIPNEPEPEPEQKTLEFEKNLDEHGIATFEVIIPDDNVTFYSVRCKFLDSSTYLSSLSKFTPSTEAMELLKINVNPEKPRLAKSVSVEIASREAIPYFVYTIVGRGNILKTEHVQVPDNRKSYTIKFTPTFEMVPKASLYVHYIYDNELRFEEKTIEFEKDFENFIDIDAPVQTKPGEEVTLTVKTDPESFVGLLGVDQSVLLLKSGNDLSKDQIFNSLNNFDTSTPWMRGYGRYPGQQSGLVTLTNAHYPYNEDFLVRPYYLSFGGAPGPMVFGAAPAAAGVFAFAATAGGSRVEPPKIRKEFPENWIFQDIKDTTADGLTVSKKIPDTITSWVITGFSLNKKTGFALTADPRKINVFQPFFISTNLPYSVKRGEVIAIPVIVFNYLDKNLDAEITMDNTDGEFEFTEAINEIDESTIDAVKRVKRIVVPPSTGKSVSFVIRPKQVGQATLKITAITPLAGDAIHQTLKVEPEGVTQFENRAVFINLKDKPEYSEKLVAAVPENAVHDSEYIEFSVVGDLLGPTIKNLDKLVRMPYGCGEQNMVNFVPNILVLKYLDAIGQQMPAIVEKAKKFMEIGYQRELTYKHDDGSYSAFGKSDKAGSTWLTAYVVRSFHQAAKYIDIDPKIITQGLDFLASKQAANGSFPEYGKLFDNAHQDELGLSAYVLLAFLENEEQLPKYGLQVEKGIDYIHNNVEKSDNVYSLAITASVLQLAKHPLAEKVLAKIGSLAKQENDRKWWAEKPETKPDASRWYWRAPNKDVEITAYVMLALLEKDSAESALPILKWLISQRNSNGGFSSTQDTVVGLEALIKFAQKTGSGSGELDIEFTSSGGAENKGSISVNKDNTLVLQTHVLPKSTRTVDFTAKGKGSAMVQLSYRYNIVEKDKKPSFEVKVNIKDNAPPQQLLLDVCAEFVPTADNDAKDSNMAVMEVALPSGFIANSDSFEHIEKVDRVKRVETKNSDSVVIIYFDSLTKGEPKCVKIEATKAHAVAKLKPAAVSIYDYYDTERRATEYYEVKTSLCDICEGDDCGDGCKKD